MPYLLKYGSSNAIISLVDKVLAKIRRNPRNVRFGDLRKVCDHYFGQPRAKGSHLFYKVPWQEEPLVNIQPVRGHGQALSGTTGAQGDRQLGGVNCDERT